MRFSGTLLTIILVPWLIASAPANASPQQSSALTVPAAAAPAATGYSELKLGGRLVAYAYWNGATNTFQVNDAYGDDQSAVVRYRLGSGKKVSSAWNSGGQLTSATRVAPAGGLTVRFRACRADRTERNFTCPSKWVKATSSCLKHPGTAALKGKGVCVGTRGQVLREGSPQNGWGYRLKGRIAAFGTHGRAGRLEVRTHRSGESWGGPSTVAKAAAGKSATFDQVVHRGGYAFWIQYRLCSATCTAWGGDMVVGIASARELR